MKPLHVLLIHRDSDNYRRLTGWWSYAVPEFTWDTQKVQRLDFDVRVEPGRYDLVVLDDWIFGTIDKGGTPLAYVTVDSARSDYQLKRNLEQGAFADIFLVDSDKLSKFSNNGKPARRFAYAVNENLYKPQPKEYDVAFLCWPTDERRVVERYLSSVCETHGWKYLTGTYADPFEYAAALAKAKIVVHKSHVVQARSWRVFDVMACKGCLLTNPIPLVDGDGIYPDAHYLEYKNLMDLERQIAWLLDDDRWLQYANAGYRQVTTHHLWRHRAKELRETLQEALWL